MASSADTEPAVAPLLAALSSPAQRADCLALVALMSRVTGAKPRLWGKMVGFGQYHYKYASGREGDAFLVGFAPRKNEITLYLGCNLDPHRALLEALGRHKAGKGCVYIRSLADLDVMTLERLIVTCIADLRAAHG